MNCESKLQTRSSVLDTNTILDRTTYNVNACWAQVLLFLDPPSDLRFRLLCLYEHTEAQQEPDMHKCSATAETAIYTIAKTTHTHTHAKMHFHNALCSVLFWFRVSFWGGLHISASDAKTLCPPPPPRAVFKAPWPGQLRPAFHFQARFGCSFCGGTHFSDKHLTLRG